MLGRGSALGYTLRSGQHPTAKGTLALPCLGLLPALTRLCWCSNIEHYCHLPIAHSWVWGLGFLFVWFFLITCKLMKHQQKSLGSAQREGSRLTFAIGEGKGHKGHQQHSRASRAWWVYLKRCFRDPTLLSPPSQCQRLPKHSRSPPQSPRWWRGLSNISRKLCRRFSLMFWCLNCCFH